MSRLRAEMVRADDTVGKTVPSRGLAIRQEDSFRR